LSEFTWLSFSLAKRTNLVLSTLLLGLVTKASFTSIVEGTPFPTIGPSEAGNSKKVSFQQGRLFVYRKILFPFSAPWLVIQRTLIAGITGSSGVSSFFIKVFYTGRLPKNGCLQLSKLPDDKCPSTGLDAYLTLWMRLLYDAPFSNLLLMAMLTWNSSTRVVTFSALIGLDFCALDSEP